MFLWLPRHESMTMMTTAGPSCYWKQNIVKVKFWEDGIVVYGTGGCSLNFFLNNHENRLTARYITTRMDGWMDGGEVS